MSHHTTTLHRGRKAVAATLIAAAAVALTACDDSKADAKGSSSVSSSAAPASSTQGGASASGGSGGSAGSTGSTGAGQGNGATAGKNTSATRPAAGARCTTDSLKAGWGAAGGGRPDMHSDAQQTAAVWLKNIGSSACTIGGFPGVQIKGTDGGTLDLPRSAKKPVTLRLKPGEHTTFTITLLPSVNGGDKKITPGTVTLTPPNEKKPFQLQWPFGGAILDQSGATHPGTFVNPVNVP